MRRYSLFFIAPFVFGLDRLSKYYVEKMIENGGRVEYTSFFSLVHVRNYGGAFNLFSDSEYKTFLFVFLPLIVVCVLLLLLFFANLNKIQTISILFILGGATGNLYDRIVKGYVVDFLDFGYRNFHWPAFNIADTFVTLGIFLLILVEFGRKN